MKQTGRRYEWFAIGDVNGFFGLMFDNVTVLSFLAGILVFAFGFPADIVYTKMFPGTAFGVLFGDLVYTWMAFRLAKKTGNTRVTAMPLGLDTPSTIGIALVVLGPAFVSLKAQGMEPHEAAMMTWYIGMATMIMIGIIKLVLSFCGRWVQKVVPQAGLLGSLASVAVALIGFVPLLDIFGMPLIGLISLGLILYNLVARIRLPKNVPGVLAAIAIGTALYYILGPHGWVGGTYTPLPELKLQVGFPVPTLLFVKGFVAALKYLPLAVPFALLTVVGGINVTESARVAGDDFNTRNILLAEAVATLIAGVCGGVAQSTPYIGQPAYKGMGARAGYTALTGVFIGLGGILGYVGYIVELIPRAVLAPLLIFVALDIMVQAFLACPARHAPAVAFAYVPRGGHARGAAREDREGASRGARHDRGGQRLHPHRYALGRVPRGADRPQAQALGALPRDPGCVFVLRGHPLGIARREHVPPVVADDPAATRDSVPVRVGVRGARRDAAAALAVEGEQGAPARRPRTPGDGARAGAGDATFHRRFMSQAGVCSNDRHAKIA